MSTTTVLNPVAGPSPALSESGLGLDSLEGKRLGFLSNNKPNSEVLLEAVAKPLSQRLGVSIRGYNKGVPSLNAPAELLEQIDKECDAVVLAIND